ncbi:hypothetical protein E6P97_00310 [Patescibacteria group bacterium]|nr:MAG: hypothetical protein E6P97_00310 [Patescibacteria group bacterium]
MGTSTVKAHAVDMEKLRTVMTETWESNVLPVVDTVLWVSIDSKTDAEQHQGVWAPPGAEESALQLLHGRAMQLVEIEGVPEPSPDSLITRVAS